MFNLLNDIGGDANSNVPNPYYLGGLAHKFNWQGLIDQRHKSDEYAQQYAQLKNQEFENALKQQSQINDYIKQLDEAPILDIHRKQILDTEKKLQKPFDDLLNKYNGNIGDALSSREGRMIAMQYTNGLQNAITPEMRQAAALKKQYTDAEFQGKSMMPAFDKNNNPLTSWQEVEDAYNAGDKGVLGTLGGVMKFNKNDLYPQVEKRIPEYNPNLETPEQYLKGLDEWKRGMPKTQRAEQSAIEFMALNGRPYNPNNRSSQAMFEMFKKQFDQQPAQYSRYDNSKDETIAQRKLEFAALQEQRAFTNQLAKDKAAGKPYADLGVPSRATYSVSLPTDNVTGEKTLNLDYQFTPIAMSDGKPVVGVVNANSSIIPPQTSKGNVSVSANGKTTKYAENESIGGELSLDNVSGKCIILGTSDYPQSNPELIGLPKKEVIKRIKSGTPEKTKITSIVLNGVRHDVPDYAVKYNTQKTTATTQNLSSDFWNTNK